MDENPYESPKPVEEPVAVGRRGVAWSGWERIRRIGAWSFFGSMLFAIGLTLSEWKPSDYVTVALGVGIIGGLVLLYGGRLGAYLNRIVRTSRGDYD
jgi:hypothetical protein